MEKSFALGKLTFLRTLPKYKAEYECFCGNIFIANVYKVASGHTKSCGCFQEYSRRNSQRTHGETKTRLYQTWSGIKKRCYNPKDKFYHRYGARGIKMCSEWLNSFEKFRDWALANGYAAHLKIDRKNNDKDYTPRNCRWANDKIQAINKLERPNKLGYKGISLINGKYWIAKIQIDGKRVYLGIFDAPEEAHAAYLNAKKKRDTKYLKELKEKTL